MTATLPLAWFRKPDISQLAVTTAGAKWGAA